MFLFLGILFIALGGLPLVMTIRTSDRLPGEVYSKQLKLESGFRRFALPVAAGLALLPGLGVSALCEPFPLFIDQADSATVDPIFGKSGGFYLFSLPFYSPRTPILKQIWITCVLAFPGATCLVRGRRCPEYEELERLKGLIEPS